MKYQVNIFTVETDENHYIFNRLSEKEVKEVEYSIKNKKWVSGIYHSECVKNQIKNKNQINCKYIVSFYVQEQK